MSTLAAVPPPPREPSPRAKQLIYAYTGSQFAGLLTGLIFLLIGGVLSTVFCWGLPGELAITLAGRRATGTIERTELQRNVTINGRHPTAIAFTFEGHSGESSTLEPGALSAGDVVEVEYVPWRPAWARVRGGTYGSFPVWVAFVLLFPLVGLGALFGAVRSKQRDRRAFRDGRAIGGTVTRVGLDRRVRVNGRHPLKVEWSFEVEGRQFTGSLSSLDPERLRDFRESDAVTVLYDPDQPQANTVWVDG